MPENVLSVTDMHKIYSGGVHAVRGVSFEVNEGANKVEVKEAVEKNFDVTVLDVNTTKLHGKKKRYGPRIKQRPDTKKAVVTLKQGDRINLIEGL